MPRRLPARRYLNSALTEAGDEDVVLFEAVAVAAGEEVTLTFEEVNSTWRQGVWLATDGLLAVAGQRSPQVVLWSDTAPRAVDLLVESTDGLLRLYNVWDSGRGVRPHESQAATSGMLTRPRADGSVEYRCHDFGPDPSFDKLVFTLAHKKRKP